MCSRVVPGQINIMLLGYIESSKAVTTGLYIALVRPILSGFNRFFPPLWKFFCDIVTLDIRLNLEHYRMSPQTCSVPMSSTRSEYSLPLNQVRYLPAYLHARPDPEDSHNAHK